MARLVGGLGVAQLLAWGVLYYAITVLGVPMAVELALEQEALFGAFTWALTLAAVLAPSAGKLLDRYGGRAVLIASALLGALGFSVLARAHSLSAVVMGWSINGLAMALGLYDTCFAALGQVTPRRYSEAVTGVTLIAGLASTVAWPASYYLLQLIGWRYLCDVYAVVLCVCGAIYLAVLPRESGARFSDPASGAVPLDDPQLCSRARLLALTFAGIALIGASLSAHLLTVLETARVSRAQGVWVASSIGVMQVLGRLMHAKFASRVNPYRLGMVTFGGFVMSVLMLLSSQWTPWLLLPFAVIYGISNGLITIAKATVPVELLGLRNVGQVLGSFSRPSLVTRALGPLSFSVLMGSLGTTNGLVAIALVGVVSLTLYIAATRDLGSLRRDVPV